MNRWRFLLTLLPACGLLLLSGEARGAPIRDLAELNQDPRAHVEAAAAKRPLLPPADQARLNAEHEALHFEPWNQQNPRHDLAKALWGFRKYEDRPGFGKKGQPHPADWIRRLEANADFAAFPRGGFKAVTLRRADIRRLPSAARHTDEPRPSAGEYPFDNLQESTVPAGSPIRVLHKSRDGKWLLVETSYILGWVRPEALAPVTDEFIRRWQNGRYVTVVRDKVPVTAGGKTLFAAALGSLYPRLGEAGRQVRIGAAVRGRDGRAVLREASLPGDAVADTPLPFTPANAARLARELAGEPYGWGGLLGRRDCSALTRDLMGPFGLWLPRNSAEQAGNGRYISLKGLPDDEKEARIVAEGVPWRTLLWMPGHIMVYIGHLRGQALIFHNFWSIRTRNGQGAEKRVVVGRAAVTSLRSGRDLPAGGLPRTDTLRAIAGMTLLGETPTGGPLAEEQKP
jgi:cell wall-associated NlpC family hydrolase